MEGYRWQALDHFRGLQWCRHSRYTWLQTKMHYHNAEQCQMYQKYIIKQNKIKISYMVHHCGEDWNNDCASLKELLWFMSANHHNIKLLWCFKVPLTTKHDMQTQAECPCLPLASAGHYIHIADFIKVFTIVVCLRSMSFISPPQSLHWSEMIIVALRRKWINPRGGNKSSRQCWFSEIHACT